MTKSVVMFEAAAAGTDPRMRKEIEVLARAGYSGTVLVWDRSGTGQESTELCGWPVENVGPLGSHGGGLKSIPGYREYWARAAARAIELKPDVLHCHDLDTVPAALKALEGLPASTRLVLDFWELYRLSRALPQAGLVGVAARAVARRLEKASIPRADLVITVVEGQVEYYRALGARRVVVVENAPDIDRFPVVCHNADDFTVCFLGSMRYIDGLVTLAHAIQPHPAIRARFAGAGPAAERLAEAVVGLERIELSGRFEPSEAPAIYAGCDAVFATYDTSLYNWRTAFPVKVQEAMACGLPVIVEEDTWIGEYVTRHGFGLTVDDHDVEDVGAAVLALAEDRTRAREMGMRGRVLAEKDINWEAASARLVDGYERLWASS